MYEGDTTTVTVTLKGKDSQGKYTVPLSNATEVEVSVFGPAEATLPMKTLSGGGVTNAGSGKYTARFDLSLGAGRYVAVTRTTSPTGEKSTGRAVFFADPVDED